MGGLRGVTQAASRHSRMIFSAHLAMLGFAFLVSTSFPVGEVITGTLDPAVLTCLRMVLAAALLAGVILVRGGRLSLPRLHEFALCLWLACLLAAFFVTMFEGLRHAPALSISAVFTLVPPMTALISRVVLGQSLSRLQITTLVVAALAAIWVVFRGDVERIRAFELGKGELIFLFGCAAYAAYSPSVRRWHRDQSMLELTFWVSLICAALLAIWNWPVLILTRWQEVPLTTFAGIVHLAIFTTALSFMLMQYASKYLPSGKVMAYGYLIPALVVAQKTALGAPWPSPAVMTGVGVIAAAVLALQRSARWS